MHEKDPLFAFFSAIKERFKFNAARRGGSRRGSSNGLSSAALEAKECDVKDRDATIFLDVVEDDEVGALPGQERVSAFEGEEVLLTARSNEEPEK